MPPQPKRGVQPSILDRLIDPESAGTAIMTGYSVQQMYGAVLRDLEDLLNTVHTAHTIPPEHAETRDSVAAYGLPDLASVEAISAEQRASIGKAIKKAIERYEPRLKQVKVTLLPGDKGELLGAVRFRIDARLTVDPAPEVAFDTILEMGSGTYLVTPAAAP
ncbi:MAG: type VI secretion system baseplate subunit TssE [Gemmataceae bacterium]|nr:type VI secretion system baseplate subunit TssE [Gemmataceae bacterium]